MLSGSSVLERYEEFFRAHADQVRRYSATLVPPDQVDDIVQQSMVTAWRRFDSIPVDSERQWLFGVVRNHSRNAWRSGRRSEALAAAIERARPRLRASLHDNGVDPVEVDLLLHVLRELPDDDCELLVLTGWFEMTPTEIALMYDVKPGTVRVRLVRVRKRVRDRFKEILEAGESA